MLYQAGKFNVRIVRPGDAYGLDDKLRNTEDILIEFYDSRYKQTSERGQFVSRYHLSTLLDGDQWCGPIKGGLILDGGIPDWRVSAEDLQPLLQQLRDEYAPKEEQHPSGCICADCSGAELTAEND